MSARGKVIGSDLRLRVLVAFVGLLAALFLLAPRELHGAKSWKECIDESFADYNSCLTPTTSWFERKLCDIAWEFDAALCTAYIIGDIRNAYEDGSGTA
ncbi:MAG: hypothetical protein ACREK1_01255 [Longimicrobiales bacterium]